MLKQRRDSLRYEDMKFAFRKFFMNGTQCWCHQHGIAEIFELKCQDFFGFSICAASGVKLEFVKFLVNAAASGQFFMRAGFDNLALIHDHNQIGMQNC